MLTVLILIVYAIIGGVSTLAMVITESRPCWDGRLPEGKVSDPVDEIDGMNCVWRKELAE